MCTSTLYFFFFFQAEDGIRDYKVTGVQTCALPISTVRSIAAEAGIQDARGGLLPQDKLDALAELQRTRGPTAMTGDGINDAPADRKSTRLNSSHLVISYAVFCLKKKKTTIAI